MHRLRRRDRDPALRPLRPGRLAALPPDLRPLRALRPPHRRPRRRHRKGPAGTAPAVRPDRCDAPSPIGHLVAHQASRGPDPARNRPRGRHPDPRRDRDVEPVAVGSLRPRPPHHSRDPAHGRPLPDPVRAMAARLAGTDRRRAPQAARALRDLAGAATPAPHRRDHADRALPQSERPPAAPRRRRIPRLPRRLKHPSR